MSDLLYYIFCCVLILGVLRGISLMSKVESAVKGNQLSAVCTAAAVCLTLYRYHILSVVELWICIAVGLIAGLLWAYRIKMIEMPEVVALLNGFGGAASALVATISMLGGEKLTVFGYTTAALALAVGAVTFTGSLIAAGKLHKVLSQRPVIWKNHQSITTLTLALMLITIFLIPANLISLSWGAFLCAVAGCFFGSAFAIRVGGADMPITISLLNSLSGVAGSIAGMAIGDPLLVAVGGIVGSSGLLLTQIMCGAMNRHLGDILTGRTSAPAISQTQNTNTATVHTDSESTEIKSKPAEFLKQAKRVIIVPGYGMAIAQAQHLVKQLADKLEQNGATVDFAIHPVAGRMPGHMNVLLAEADVAYEKLREMDNINPEFKNCDVAVIIGANDVVNPAANTAKDTPIYGMPILSASDAKNIIVCNYDSSPGYAGVPNPLYEMQNVTLVFGDAQKSVQELISGL